MNQDETITSENWTDFLSSSVQALRVGDEHVQNWGPAHLSPPHQSGMDKWKEPRPDPFPTSPLFSPVTEKMMIKPPPRIMRWSWDCQDTTISDLPPSRRHYSLDLGLSTMTPKPTVENFLSTEHQENNRSSTADQRFNSPLMQSRTCDGQQWSLHTSVTNNPSPKSSNVGTPEALSSKVRPQFYETSPLNIGLPSPPGGEVFSRVRSKEQSMFMISPSSSPELEFSYSPGLSALHSPLSGHSLCSSTHGAMKEPDWYYEVEFKQYRRSIFSGSPTFRIGDFVKVQADRGQDLGQIIRISCNLETLRSDIRQNAGACSDKRVTFPLKRIAGLATADELSRLGKKFEREKEVLKFCCSKVKERSLPMKVIDAEYQFDHHKLTFYFKADHRIDFRELVRDLFATYKTRIWMQQLSE